ncbi:MAG: serpin family protein [Deltaproteobacteria bacterium]|nr:serpin family protein [Deltaproteobacteria bacterium]
MPDVANAVGTPDAWLADSSTQFGLSLFSRLHGGADRENVFISPASVFLALAMTYNGAEGATKTAMAKVLGLEGRNIAEIHTGVAALHQLLKRPDPKIEVAIANGLWGKPGVDFHPTFLQQAKQVYKAAVAPLQSSDAINTWVSKATRGKITSIIDELSSEAILVLVNAIYFKGKWGEPFDREATQERPFTLPNSAQKHLPMMTQSDEYWYSSNKEMQAIKLPYGAGRIQMYIVLPAIASNLPTLLQGLDAKRWETWMRQFTWREGTLVLPRFRLEYRAQLNEALTALGMANAFTDQAEFGGIATVPPGWWIRIDQVLHKTFVEVNEEGTEAAAATEITMKSAAAEPGTKPPPPFQMIVDRPFLCAIRDEQTGLLLFLGAVVEP